MYKHIIWDFDGTLFDAYPVMVKAMIHTLDKNGITENESNVFKLMKVSYPYLLNYLKDKYSITEEFIAEFKLNCDKLEDKYLEPFDRAQDICEKITQNGKYNHLFTHRDKSAIKYLEKYDMYHFFSEIIIKESGFPRKPSPEGIEYIIEKYTINRQEAIIIGDRALDLESGKNAEISSCYFNIIDNTTLPSADYMIVKLSELNKIIF